MIVHSPPSDESVARGSVLGEQMQVPPCVLEVSASPLRSCSAASHL